MSDVVEAAVIASLATLVGTLGTQWLSDRRERARSRGEANAARIAEIRGLLEEAALAARDALDILEHSTTHPEWAARPPHSQTLSSTVMKLKILDTRLALRVPSMYRFASDWRLVFTAFPTLRRALSAANASAAQIGDAAPTDAQRTAFAREVAELRSSLVGYQEVVAWAFGAKPNLHLTRRQRLRYRWDDLAESAARLRGRLRRHWREPSPRSPTSGDVPRNKPKRQ